MVTYEKFQKDMLAVRKLMGRKPLEPRKQIKISESNYKKLLSFSGKTFDDKLSRLLIEHDSETLYKRFPEKRVFRSIPNHTLDAYILLAMKDKAEWKRSEIVEEVLSRLSERMDVEEGEQQSLLKAYLEQAREMARSMFHHQIDNRLKAMLRSGEITRGESSEAIRNKGFIYKLFVKERILDGAVEFWTNQKLSYLPDNSSETEMSYYKRLQKIGTKVG